MASAEKKWRVDTWIDGIDARRVAAKLEGRLNKYEEEGYDIYDVSIDQGIVIARQRESEDEEPDDYQSFMRTALNNMQQMGGAPPQKIVTADGRYTSIFLGQISEMMRNGGVFALSAGTPEARVDEVIRQTFGAVAPIEVHMTLADIERAKLSHQDCGAGCLVSKIFEVSLAGLNRYIQANPSS